ncbi:MAG: cytochrome c-type biogenesis protein CcmH [Chloroflexi bacterium]|nr:cytochrome c-type biogenesis protein CcmH [Chloroflexota bacterium]
MKRSFPLFSTLLLALALAFLAGCMTQSAPSLEEEAQAIDAGLMCPVCPAETIDQSQVPLAKQMRAIVREKLAAGETKEQIQAFFVERYGESVLAAPKKGGFSLAAWGIPLVGVVLGGATVALVVRGMMRKRDAKEEASEAAGSGDTADAEMAPYLQVVDEDLKQILGRAYKAPSGNPDRRG